MFLIISLISSKIKIKRRELLLSGERDPKKLQVHFFGNRGFVGVEVEGGAGHLSQSTAMDFGVTSSWFKTPFVSIQQELSLKKQVFPKKKMNTKSNAAVILFHQIMNKPTHTKWMLIKREWKKAATLQYFVVFVTTKQLCGQLLHLMMLWGSENVLLNPVISKALIA